MASGFFMIAVAVTGVVVILLSSAGDPAVLAIMGGVAALGATMIGSVIVSLPKWARLRQQQMEDVAAKLESL